MVMITNLNPAPGTNMFGAYDSNQLNPTVEPAQQSQNPYALPPSFNYTPSSYLQSQLNAAKQQQQFNGLLSGNPSFSMQQNRQAPIYSGFNAPSQNPQALAAQYLGK